MSRAVEKARRQAAVLAVAHLQHVMSTPEGRGFVWATLDRTGLYASLMANNAGTTSFLIGRRQVGLDLLTDIKTHCFNEFRLMEDEAIARDTRMTVDSAAPDDHSEE